MGRSSRCCAIGDRASRVERRPSAERHSGTCARGHRYFGPRAPTSRCLARANNAFGWLSTGRRPSQRPKASRSPTRGLLRWLLSPADAPPPKSDGSAHIFRAIGEVNEIRGVLRRCLAENIPLDQVELLCTDKETYIPLIYEMFARLMPTGREPRQNPRHVSGRDTGAKVSPGTCARGVARVDSGRLSPGCTDRHDPGGTSGYPRPRSECDEL